MVTADVKEAFQCAYVRGQSETEALVGTSGSQEVDGLDIQVELVGVDEDESSWEPLETIEEGAPHSVGSELRELGLNKQSAGKFVDQVWYHAVIYCPNVLCDISCGGISLSIPTT